MSPMTKKAHANDPKTPEDRDVRSDTGRRLPEKPKAEERLEAAAT